MNLASASIRLAGEILHEGVSWRRQRAQITDEHVNSICNMEVWSLCNDTN